ncbi:hypothetical protein [Enterovirga rhinocerotis]|uniref:Uncharacterized protein n=1 Tax=Enterovirga rhinocerotis TaxID=1339210 RepID=A0A4R7BTH0_9HYPH|nr:hypothetical protein [Enterovirga rhinocerotis]TDR89020.1 hypothetical protein EV668_3505 [Enterovirga rhinocerotis]
MTDILAIVLQGAGLFYLLAAFAGLRSVAMDRFLSQAIDALAPRPEAEQKADRLRNGFLAVSLLAFGIAGAALLARLEVALPLLAAVLGLQIVYLGILAPRLVDPAGPPDPGSRSKSWLLTAILGALAILAFAAWRIGALFPFAQAPIGTSVFAAACLALAAFAIHLARSGTRRSPSPPDAEPDLFEPDDDNVHDDTDPGVSHGDPETIRLVVTPSWGHGSVLDAANGLPISHRLRLALLTEEERMLLADWNCLFIDVADPSDPRRARLEEGDALAKLDALGRPIAESIAARLGPDRVAFEPAPRPVPPRIAVSAIKVMADYGCHALWFHEDPDRVGCFSAGEFGLSWALTCSLGGWAVGFDERLDPDDPGGGSRWSAAEEAEHLAEGHDIARRLAAELAETDRGHVAVFYHPTGGTLERVAVQPTA